MAALRLPNQHRWKKWTKRIDWPLGLLLVFLTLWFGGFILSGRVVLPLVEGVQGTSSRDVSVSESLWRSTGLADQMHSQFAADTYTATRLRAGELPLWQPQLGFGTPHFAAAAAGVLAPTRLLSILIAGDPVTAWMVGVALAATLAGLFTYLFLRQLQIPRPYAAIGGLVFCLHPAILLTGWLGSLSAMMWLPYLLWQTERHLRLDHAFLPVVWIVMGIAATFYSGDAVASMVVVALWLLYVIVRLIYRWWLLERAPESRPHVMHYGLILLLGIAFAGPQVWPALIESVRSGSLVTTWQQWSGEFTTVGERLRGYDWRELLLAWIPLRYALLWFDIGAAETEGWFNQVGRFMGMTQTAFFVLAWWLAPRRRQLWFWTGIILFGGVMAFIFPSLAPLSWAFTAIAGLIVTVYGVEAVCARNLLALRPLALGVGVLLALELSFAGFSIWPLVKHQVVESGLQGQYAREYDAGQTYLLDLDQDRLTLAGRDGQSLASPFAPSRSPLRPALATSAGEGVLDDLDWQGIGFVRAADVASIVAAGGVLSRNLTKEGAGVMLHNEQALPLYYLAKHAAVFGTRAGVISARDGGKIDLAQTVVLESGFGEEAIFDPLTTSLPTPFTPVQLVSLAPERVVARVDSAEPALLVRLVEYGTDWRVLVDGVPARIVRTNGHFQGVLLSPGVHEVVFEYRPMGLLWGGLGSLGGLGVLGAWWLRILRQRRHAERLVQEHFHVV